MYKFREWSISLDLYKNKLHSKEYFVKDITKQNKIIKKQTKKKQNTNTTSFLIQFNCLFNLPTS